MSHISHILKKVKIIRLPTQFNTAILNNEFVIKMTIKVSLFKTIEFYRIDSIFVFTTHKLFQIDFHQHISTSSEHVRSIHTNYI